MRGHEPSRMLRNGHVEGDHKGPNRPRPYNDSAPIRSDLIVVACAPPTFRMIHVPETLIRRQTLFLQDTPDLPGGDRNIDMPHPYMSQRVDHRVGDGLRSADGGRFTDALGADGMMWRGSIGLIGLPTRRLHRGRYQVVLEIAAQDVAILIVRDLLVHCRSKTLRQATMNLPLDDHWIDDRAAVVHSHEAADMHLPRSTVDIDDADVAAEWIRQVGRVVIIHGLQSRLKIGRTIGVGSKREFLNRLALVGRSLDEETPRLPLEVIFADLQQVGGNLLRLFAHFTSRQGSRGTGDGRAAAGIGTKSIRSCIRVAMLDIDIVRRHTKFGGDDLREGRFVPLALRLHADAGQRFAGRMHANLAAIEHLNARDIKMLARAGPNDFGETGDADAHQLTTGALLRLFAAQSLVIYILHRQM